MRCGMDADASVVVEFIDYDCDCHRHKYDHHKFKEEVKKCGKPDKGCHFSCEHEGKGCSRVCDISVVLRAIVRVMNDREIIVVPGTPFKPKG